MDTTFYESPLLAIGTGLSMVALAFELWWHRSWKHVRVMLRLIMIGAMLNAFGIYELRMKQWERTVRNPIRIDLLVLLPVMNGLAKEGYQVWQVSRLSERAPSK
ncbi:MAG: hypothetical protein U0796_03895 [Gemmatales bacterium]